MDLFNEAADTAGVEDIIDTVVMLNARHEASRQEDDSDSRMTPRLKELFGYLEIHELDAEELSIPGQYVQEMQTIQSEG